MDHAVVFRNIAEFPDTLGEEVQVRYATVVPIARRLKDRTPPGRDLWSWTGQSAEICKHAERIFPGDHRCGPPQWGNLPQHFSAFCTSVNG